MQFYQNTAALAYLYSRHFHLAPYSTILVYGTELSSDL
jgi:hypothetical protein